MALTEEQREAIEIAIGLYDDEIRYLVEGKYSSGQIEGFEKYRAVLRDMVDSGDQFGEPNKLMGFDLEVRWHDDYMKRFSNVTRWRCGHATLWIMHSNGKQEWIPLASVRRISSVEASQ